MFKSLGNLLVNPNVGLLFIAMHGRPQRLRVNGTARVSRDDPLLAHTVGAQLIVRVQASAIFPNCPRYIPKLELVEPSVYVPQPGQDPVEPAWKTFDVSRTSCIRANRHSGAKPAISHCFGRLQWQARVQSAK